MCVSVRVCVCVCLLQLRSLGHHTLQLPAADEGGEVGHTSENIGLKRGGIVWQCDGNHFVAER